MGSVPGRVLKKKKYARGDKRTRQQAKRMWEKGRVQRGTYYGVTIRGRVVSEDAVLGNLSEGKADGLVHPNNRQNADTEKRGRRRCENGHKGNGGAHEQKAYN